jgi:hypothetical protein
MFYFPLIPRLLATYRSPTMAPHMRFHAKHRSSDGIMRGPYDGEAWQVVLNDPQCDFMAKEDRNVWFGMAMDGMNSFFNNSSSHSIWPVVLILYNLPPWMAIQKGHIILSCIIPNTKIIYLHITMAHVLICEQCTICFNSIQFWLILIVLML